MMLATIILLSENAEEFSFNHHGKQEFHIDGKLIDGEWIVNVRAYSELVIWGCNRYNTHKRFKTEVVRYFLMLFVNQLSEYGIFAKELLNLTKNVL